MTSTDDIKNINDDYRYGFAMPERATHKVQPGLNAEVVSAIADIKQEPEWMRLFRQRSYEIFLQKPMPEWGANLTTVDFDSLTYFIRATDEQKYSWEDLPAEIKDTYDRIGVPKAERDFLAGVSAQYESEVVYESIKSELESQGVIFCDMDTAVRRYPDLVKKYFGTLVPPSDNKFAALNSAVWSGGSFIYIPKGVKVELPLQAYFRINSQSFGQFERTLIIADEGSYVHYTEGCTAPIYSSNSLHAAVVEIFVGKNAHVRYTTVQNWSKNIFNLVTKRAKVSENGLMQWIDCNLGSCVTMKYPAIYLIGRKARGETYSIAYAGKGQHQDAGAKMLHLAPETSSRVISKSISKHGGRTSYRGLTYVPHGSTGSKSYVACDALILDAESRSDTYPVMKVHENESVIQHEATVERISEEKLFYLGSRGVNRQEAEGLLVNGFIDQVTKEIPLEYTVELYRLMNAEMEGSVG